MSYITDPSGAKIKIDEIYQGDCLELLPKVQEVDKDGYHDSRCSKKQR